MLETDIIREEITYEDCKIGGVIHEVKLTDNKALGRNRLKCNSTASLLVLKGSSKDWRYKWYPFWALEIYDKDGNKVRTALTKELFFSLIDEFFIHEERVDQTRNRTSDVPKYEQALKEIVLRIQKKLERYDIPEIYKKQK
jgi:two-component SAPR family response regulator